VRVGERGAFGLVDSPASTLNQAVTIQDRVHGADGRAVDLGVLAAQAVALVINATVSSQRRV
jgi:hypothetical protein